MTLLVLFLVAWFVSAVLVAALVWHLDRPYSEPWGEEEDDLCVSQVYPLACDSRPAADRRSPRSHWRPPGRWLHRAGARPAHRPYQPESDTCLV